MCLLRRDRSERQSKGQFRPLPHPPHARGRRQPQKTSEGAPQRPEKPAAWGPGEKSTWQTHDYSVPVLLACPPPTHRCYLGESVRLGAWRGPFLPYSPGLDAAVDLALFAEPGEELSWAARSWLGRGCNCVFLWGPLLQPSEVITAIPSSIPLAGWELTGIFRSQGQNGTQVPLQLHWPEMATAPCVGGEGTECGDRPTGACAH